MQPPLSECPSFVIYVTFTVGGVQSVVRNDAAAAAAQSPVGHVPEHLPHWDTYLSVGIGFRVIIYLYICFFIYYKVVQIVLKTSSYNYSL